VPSSPPRFAENQYNREEAAGPTPPVLAGERDLEKAAVTPSSSSLAPKQLDRQDATASSSPPLASERNLEEAAAIPSSPSLGQSQFGREEAVMPPNFPRIAQKQVDREQPVAESSLPAIAQRQLDREEVTVLLKRGKDLIANGDIAAARLVLQRAAEANDVEATLALAATYDPYVLRELKVYSFAGDAGMARAWYEKARELGSPAALRRLEMLTRGAR
jgi:Flp pilus assembly protein TadD